MDRNTGRLIARAVAIGRIGIGTVAVVAPTAATAPWVGPMAKERPVRLLARAMGGRDLALGIGALRALERSDEEARPWVALGGLGDTIDTLVTLFAFSRLPRWTRFAVLGSTAGAAVLSLRSAQALDDLDGHS